LDVVQLELDWAGRRLRLETGRLAKQANGAVLATYGDTVVLATAVMSREVREGIDFFPLTVDFEERLYAVGRIPGGFIKREGRATERAILAGRLIDRPIRPLFPKGFRNDVQVIATVLSVDHDAPVDITAMIGASAALHISDIPFAGPIAGLQVGLIDGRLVFNPTVDEAELSRLHLTVAGSRDAVIMIEAGADEVPEADILRAIREGHRFLQPVLELQEELRARAGKEKAEVQLFLPTPELEERARALIGSRLEEALHVEEKQAREARIEELRQDVRAALGEEFPDQSGSFDAVFDAVLKKAVRKQIVLEGVRPDGRRPDEIRPISCDVGVLPRTHGSGLFTRGQTQVLTVCTLGALDDVQILDGIGVEEMKRYLHHYNFPPFSTGEARPLRAPSRRSIGHGALAERALLPMIPPMDTFPYTIRLVSEVLESNGSTSMASVCGSTLALMDAAVPIKAPVAGVAMGLVKEGEHVVVLTDIQGMEDALGDMDFKVAGTEAGVTAIQMDIKIAGLDDAVLERALAEARKGRLFILGKMRECIAAPRKELSPFAPRVIVMKVPTDKIREVIGPGGRTINRIIDETRVGNHKVAIDIEDDGTIHISSVNEEAGRRAVEMIRGIIREPEVGELYHGRVTRILNFGAFVEILPGKEGLIHISQLADERVGKVEDVLKVGDEVWVKLVEIDAQGRLNLSRKAALKEMASRS
jgi:polyribonucleotide nucleotidyltransferase